MNKTNNLSPISPKSPRSTIPQGKKAGYEYLLAYKITVPIYDYTVEFCNRWIDKYSRTTDQTCPPLAATAAAGAGRRVNGASRSNPQNIAEDYTHQSLKGYIYLVGIASGSNEELAKDYEDFLRQRSLQIWGEDHPGVREFREFRAVWKTQTIPNTPQLPQNPKIAANMLLTLCNMEGFLLKKLVEALKLKHQTEGGLTEKLYHARISYRKSRRAGKNRKKYRGF